MDLQRLTSSDSLTIFGNHLLLEEEHEEKGSRETGKGGRRLAGIDVVSYAKDQLQVPLERSE